MKAWAITKRGKVNAILGVYEIYTREKVANNCCLDLDGEKVEEVEIIIKKRAEKAQ
jgi:hypothetical protein